MTYPRHARLAAAGLALALAAAGCKPKQQAQAFTPPPTPVETAVAKSGTVSDRFAAVGNLDAAERVTLVAEIDARVVSMPFHEGEPVQSGALIAQLDDAQLRSELERARALRDQSRTWYERSRHVVGERIAPEQQLDDAASALRVAEANLELAQVRLAKTRIVAPFSGVLGERKVSPGAYLKASDPIAELRDVHELKVSFSVPERFAPALHPGSLIEVSPAAFADRKLDGKVDLVEPALDAGTRSVRVRARIANADGSLRPGMSADVSALLAERPGSITIPDEAVFAEGDQFLVYVVKDDKSVTRRSVKIGTRMPGSVEIASGLEAGERVVRAGHQKLYEGAKVQPVESAAAAPSPVAEPVAEAKRSEAKPATEVKR